MTPDERMQYLRDAETASGQDILGVVWEIIGDVLGSVRLALSPHTGSTFVENVMMEVEDYIANHYGDD